MYAHSSDMEVSCGGGPQHLRRHSPQNTFAFLRGVLIVTLAKEGHVIALTRLNGQSIMINCDLIESLEPTPDTVVTLTSGNKLVVRERLDEIQAKIIDFKRKIHGP